MRCYVFDALILTAAKHISCSAEEIVDGCENIRRCFLRTAQDKTDVESNVFQLFGDGIPLLCRRSFPVFKAPSKICQIAFKEGVVQHESYSNSSSISSGDGNSCR